MENTLKNKISAELKSQLIEKVNNLISTKFFLDSSVNLEKLAKKLNTNRSYLSATINEHFGMSFSQLLNELRIEEVKKHLSNEESYLKYTMPYIASMSGFSSKSNFYISFKNLTGYTPKEYMDLMYNKSTKTEKIEC